MGCHGSKVIVTAQLESGKVALTAKLQRGRDSLTIYPCAPAEEKEKGILPIDLAGSSPSSTQSSASSTGQLSNDVMIKHRMVCTDRDARDIIVSQFTCRDSSVGPASRNSGRIVGDDIGKDCQTKHWKVMYDPDKAPIDIKLYVHDDKLQSHEVVVEIEGLTVSHPRMAKTKTANDFYYQWPVRGTVKGINEKNYFEVCPQSKQINSDMQTIYNWDLATITRQRDDGLFDVIVEDRTELGFTTETEYLAVPLKDLRVAASKNPLVLPEISVELIVPKQDPLSADLKVQGKHGTHQHLGRWSPPPSIGTEKMRVALRASRDRSKVTASVGRSVLSHFVSGEVRAVNFEAASLLRSWTVELGPFVKHTIKVFKNPTLERLVMLVVDDDVLVEASAADIGSEGPGWKCNFQLVGDRIIDFEVYKTNVHGIALHETDHVQQKLKYVHACSVVLADDRDLSSARLVIDGVDFRDLPMQECLDEPVLVMDCKMMTETYGLSLPYKVDKNPQNSFVCLSASILALPQTLYPSLESSCVETSCFTSCYCPKTVLTDGQALLRSTGAGSACESALRHSGDEAQMPQKCESLAPKFKL